MKLTVLPPGLIPNQVLPHLPIPTVYPSVGSTDGDRRHSTQIQTPSQFHIDTPLPVDFSASQGDCGALSWQVGIVGKNTFSMDVACNDPLKQLGAHPHPSPRRALLVPY